MAHVAAAAYISADVDGEQVGLLEDTRYENRLKNRFVLTKSSPSSAEHYLQWCCRALHALHALWLRSTLYVCVQDNSASCLACCRVTSQTRPTLTLLELSKSLKEAEDIIRIVRGLVTGHHEILQRQQARVLLLQCCKVHLDHILQNARNK